MSRQAYASVRWTQQIEERLLVGEDLSLGGSVPSCVGEIRNFAGAVRSLVAGVQTFVGPPPKRANMQSTSP